MLLPGSGCMIYSQDNRLFGLLLCLLAVDCKYGFKLLSILEGELGSHLKFFCTRRKGKLLLIYQSNYFPVTIPFVALEVKLYFPSGKLSKKRYKKPTAEVDPVASQLCCLENRRNRTRVFFSQHSAPSCRWRKAAGKCSCVSRD